MKIRFLLIIAFSLFTFHLSLLFGDSFTFSADRMSGARATGKEVTVLEGHAQVKSDNLTLKADRIELVGKDNNVIQCYGNVTGKESDKDIDFSTGMLTYDRKTKVATLTGNSTLEDRKNQVVARARYIEYDDNNEIAVFQISVRLFKDNMVCRSDYAVYRRKSKLLDLSGFPIVYKNDDQFSAERIRVDLDTDDVTMEGSVEGSIKQ
jgi:lipopolysaccharide export system protein LptA